MKKPKILMKLKLPDSCEKLNKRRKMRYDYRLKTAIDNNLGFRYNKKIVQTKNLKKFLKDSDYKTHQGICLVCNQQAPCSCPIEIKEDSKQVRFI